MKKLSDILYGVKIISVDGATDIGVQEICFDSRKTKEGSVFVAIRGSVSDGHNYINSVIESGCKIIVAEEKVDVPDEVTLVVTDDSQRALALMANNFFDEPSSKLKLIGVTGTNGKTTTTTLLFNLFTKLGYHCGLLSTVVNRIGYEVIPSTHTTPDPIQLNALLAEMVL